MRVLLAPCAFKETLTARQAAEAMAEGWALAAPADRVRVQPLSDGGRDFLDALHRGDEDAWQVTTTTVTGPGGEPRPISLHLHRGTRRVHLSTEEILGGPAGGLATATSRGLGEALLAARELRPSGIVVGVGETAVHDGGAGLLAALGAGPADLLGGGPLPLAGLEAVTGVRRARGAFAGVPLVAAVRDRSPLLGLDGVSARAAADRALTRERAQTFEAALSVFAHACERDLGLLGHELLGAGARLHRTPGSGAGGGLGFALAALGFELAPGPAWVADAVGLPELVGEADLVVTGEGCFDWRSLRESVAVAVADAGLAAGVPVVVLAGQVEAGRREIGSIGVESAYAVADGGPAVAAALADPAGTLTARAARVARTWSRPA